jgi:ribonucleotide monophosphatase NagD (HAD superfamily)
MSATQVLAGLSRVADQYDVLLCDVWGVIHNGLSRFPEACAALTRFQAERGPVVLISNSPRPANAVLSQLAELQVPRTAWTSFITSGDATRALLAERAPGPAWRIGPERDDVLYEGLGLTFAGPDKAGFIACTGPVDDEVETPEDYRADLTVAAERGLTMICANPDKVVHRGDRLICLAEAERLLGRAGGRALCIGDGVHTDVRGAQGVGLDCLFIAGGIHGAETVGADGMDPVKVEAALAAQHTRAAFAMPNLSW